MIIEASLIIGVTGVAAASALSRCFNRVPALFRSRCERLVEDVIAGEEGFEEDAEFKSIDTIVDEIDAQHPAVRMYAKRHLVLRAVTEIKAKMGTMSDCSANRLVVAREFRKWAGPDGLRMRPTHIINASPLVEALYFVPNKAERFVIGLRDSDAYCDAMEFPYGKRGWLVRLLGFRGPRRVFSADY
jgi:hypothetical protein